MAESGSQIAGVYRLAGLRIVSDLPLSGFPVYRDDPQEQPPDVVIRRAAIPEGLAAATAMITDGQCIGRYNGREVLIDIPATGRFLVRGGNEILVDPAPSSNDNEIRAYLLGTAFGLLCYQRGITPLHAAAIDFAGGCVAFSASPVLASQPWLRRLRGAAIRLSLTTFAFSNSTRKAVYGAGRALGAFVYGRRRCTPLAAMAQGLSERYMAMTSTFVPIRPPRNPIESRRLHRVLSAPHRLR